MEGFSRAPSEREIFRFALKGILAEYAKDHPALPFDPDDPKLDSITDYRTGFGENYSQMISRLSHRFEGTSFVVNSDTSLEISDLETTLTTSSASYPLVEVHEEYYELEAPNYQVQRGQYGHRLPALLIPLEIQEDAIFYYDPVRDFYRDVAENTLGRSITKSLFTELWSRSDLTRWALWIDQGQQRTLMDIQEAKE